MKIGILSADEAGKKAKAAVEKWKREKNAAKVRAEAERVKEMGGAPADKAKERVAAGNGEKGARAREFARHKPEPEGIAKEPGVGTELDLGSAITKELRKILSEDERKKIDAELVEAVGKEDLGAVERLLDAGADPDAKAADGRTVLIMATWDGFVEIAEILKAKGADTKAKDADGLQAISRGQGAQVSGMREVDEPKKGDGKP